MKEKLEQIREVRDNPPQRTEEEAYAQMDRALHSSQSETPRSFRDSEAFMKWLDGTGPWRSCISLWFIQAVFERFSKQDIQGKTPRTDAVAKHSQLSLSAAQVVDAEFARELERELNAKELQYAELMGKDVQAQAELAELQKDKARLDWLKKRHAYIGRNGYRGAWGYTVYVADPGGHYQEERTKEIGWGKTQREAIDSAKKGEA